MKLFGDKKICSGCRACEQVCPQKCIHMVQDSEGFLYPEIKQDLCTGCGICQKICKNTEEHIQNPLNETYALKNKKGDIVRESSSGGVFYGMAKWVIQNNGIVFGAVFDKDFKVYHCNAHNMDGILHMMGSKYVQSDTCNTFSEAKEYLEKNRLVLYSGTPCQIAGLRSYLQKDYDNLICVSVICHGVPSPGVWQRYLAYKKGEQFNDRIKNISFRNKAEGWQKFHLLMCFFNNIYTNRFEDDIYMKGFLQNLYLRPSCYQCRYKGDRDKSDIIIGDYWGIEDVHPAFFDRNGVSAVIINTGKGKKLLDKIKDSFYYISSEYGFVKERNLALTGSVSMHHNRSYFFEMLNETNNVIESIQANLDFKPEKDNIKVQQYDSVVKYLQNKLSGWSILDFLEKYNYKKVAFYSVTEFTQFVFDDINYARKTGRPIPEIYLSDLNSKKFQNKFMGYYVFSIEELVEQYNKGNIDCIIICNFFRRNAIIDDFIGKGVDLSKIITIISVIFSI